MRHDFFDIYDEYRLSNASVNFSVLYEEWKRRNNIYFPPVDPPLVLARPSSQPGLVACCSFSDGTGILPAIFVVWCLCHFLINWWYETGSLSEVWVSLCGFWSWAMANEANAQEGIWDPEEQPEGLPDSQLGAVPGNSRTESGRKPGVSPSAAVEEWLKLLAFPTQMLRFAAKTQWRYPGGTTDYPAFSTLCGEEMGLSLIHI